MTSAIGIQLGLEDLLADLHHARRQGELGRLALLASCDTRSWARQAGKTDISDKACRMFIQQPCVSKDEFLGKVDELIAILDRHAQEYQRNRSRGPDTQAPRLSTASFH